VTFPASVQTQADALAGARRTATTMKSFAQNVRDFMFAGTVSANQVQAVMLEFKTAIETWDAAKAVPGIAAYALAQYDDTTLDIAAEFTAMLSAARTVRDWVIANFPKDASGYILKDIYEADGAITVRQFTSAQTAGLRTALDSFIATVA
jgi:hypothetical protein